jgi:amino acid adenylation domain-containing protein
MAYQLAHLLMRSAERAPERDAVVFKDQRLSYGALDAASSRLARLLVGAGVRRGDRVGIFLSKQPASIVSIYGIQKAGAVYVPIDPGAPQRRLTYIVGNCGIRHLITSNDRLGRLRQAFSDGGAPSTILVVDWDAPREVAAPPGATLVPWGAALAAESDAPYAPPGIDTDLAYVLYTSGSTGEPKGVMLSHLTALTFVNWSLETFGITPEDRLSSHAPLHFDLSIFDLYVAAAAGATLVLVPPEAALFALPQAQLMADERISVWYSVPSALILMMEHGGLLEQSPQALRAVLFAGEPFPIKHLRRLKAHLPRARFLNLYGPTETNVCTWYEVGEISPERLEPVPIGIASCGDRVYLHQPAPRSEEDPTPVGELWVDGPTVMLGYWGHPPQEGPYPTGDLAYQDAEGNFVYLGRRDNMVKVRGRRIELGEIEAALLAHPRIREVGVAVRGAGVEARLVAFVACHPGAPLGLLELKRHCAERLPRYMIVDEVRTLPELPRTRNGKVDRRALAAALAA